MPKKTAHEPWYKSTALQGNVITSHRFKLNDKTHIYHNFGPFRPPSGCAAATVKLENKEVVADVALPPPTTQPRKNVHIFTKCERDPVFKEWQVVLPYERDVYHEFLKDVLGEETYVATLNRNNEFSRSSWNNVTYLCPTYFACGDCRNVMAHWDRRLHEVGLSTVSMHSSFGEQLHAFCHREGLPLDRKNWSDHLRLVYTNPYLVLKSTLFPTVFAKLPPNVTTNVLDFLFGVPSIKNAVNRDARQAHDAYKLKGGAPYRSPYYDQLFRS